MNAHKKCTQTAQPLGRPRASLGVTLMEVIFSIGVILTGLVGLAALIPIAASNARDTLELDRSISESTSAAASGLAQEFNELGTLVIFDKAAAGSTANVTGTYGFAPSNAMRTIGWKITSQSNYDPPVGATAPAPTIIFGKLETPGYGHMSLDSGLTAGICIDPWGLPELNLANQYVGAPSSTSPFLPVAGSDSAFDYSRFPYYGERYNVLAAPNAAIGAPAGPTGVTPQWPMSPRMWRATLKSPLHNAGMGTTSVIGPHQIVPASAARNIFSGSGGISSLESVNPDDPRGVLMAKTGLYDPSNNFQFLDARRDSSSDYTWFATLAPPALGGNEFRQSIVVVRQRQAPVPLRRDDPLALQKDSYNVTDAAENPAAERVVWVGDWIGFDGGAGGEVRLYGSQAVSDEIKAGEWVMLSRQPHLLGPPPVPTGPAVHRWYRVLRADDAEQISGFVWPGGTNDVWRRWVTLAGPDWVFQDESNGASSPNSIPIDDTFCTIVSGAVSVVESEVVLE